jgi:hypothetical protein
MSAETSMREEELTTSRSVREQEFLKSRAASVAD